MKRLFILLTTGLMMAVSGSVLMASPAAAVPPEKNPIEFAFSFVSPAGEICDFDLQVDLSFSGLEIAYFDQDGNLVRVFDELNVFFLGTNVATGESVSSDFHLNETFDPQIEQIAERGLWDQIRDESGRVIAVIAGRMVFDANTGEVISITPNVEPGFPIVCEVLGG
jgi:hypothetical protein